MTEQEIFDEVFVTTRRGFVPHPDLRVIERPGWLQIITPALRSGGLNEVIHAELRPDEADAAIEAAIAMYRDRNLKFRWAVGPGSAPADLGERLARHGLVGSWGRGMARAIDGVVTMSPTAATIVEVDGSTIDTFSDAMAAGWAMEPAPIRDLNRYVIARSDSAQAMFLATIDGVPAAVASYKAFARSAYLIGAVVLPAYRGRGLYRVLTEARIAHARSRGLVLATSHARESTSAPILEHLGFSTVRRFQMFHSA